MGAPRLHPSKVVRAALPEYAVQLRAIGERSSLDCLALALEESGACSRAVARTKTLRHLGTSAAKAKSAAEAFVMLWRFERRVAVWAALVWVRELGTSSREADGFLRDFSAVAERYLAGAVDAPEMHAEMLDVLTRWRATPWRETVEGGDVFYCASCAYVMLTGRDPLEDQHESLLDGLFSRMNYDDARLLALLPEGLPMLPERLPTPGRRERPKGARRSTGAAAIVRFTQTVGAGAGVEG